jgi:5,6-dimethylbenzimidazole synthase
LELHECLAKRRDTRHFLSEPVPKTVLDKAFKSAHQAPSVGLCEPWRFVLITSQEKRIALHQGYLKTRAEAALQISDPELQKLFVSLKLEALLEAPVVIGLFCERPPDSRFTIGIQGSIDTVEWSCVCAIQNLWLSISAQGYAAGWVSIIDFKLISETLKVPQTWEPLGLLCVGKPATNYGGIPMLEKENWKKRTPNPVVIEV